MARRARKTHEQLSLPKVTRKLDKHGQFRGGTHKRSGRPKRGARASERHKVRPRLLASQPVHVILRAHPAIGSLRRHDVFAAIREATYTAFRRAETFHIVHLSIQRTHIHMIVEAKDRLALAKGMKVFGISAAKHINAAVGARNGERRRGCVFTDRYHARILKSPRQVRNTINYVLNNWRHHGEDRTKLRKPWRVDPYSSALAFDGWKEREERGVLYKVPGGYDGLLVWRPKTWLLSKGWRKYALIGAFEVPGVGAGAE
jgi:REP element-mobilizing transposase RayT